MSRGLLDRAVGLTPKRRSRIPRTTRREGDLNLLARESNVERPIRLALFTGCYDYIKDGIALTLNRMVAYAEAHGFEVLVFAPTAKNAAFKHEGTLVSVPSIPLPRRQEYRLGLGLTATVRRRLAAFDPDFLHIAVPDILGYQALKFGLKRGLPVVASYHTRFDTYLKYYGIGLFRYAGLKYLRRFYDACDHVYVPSPSMGDVLQNESIARNIRLWPRGVDTQRFHPGRRSLEWRRHRAVKDDDVLVTYVGRLVREKDLSTLANVFEELQRRGVRHRSLIVGDGPDGAALRRRLPQTIFTGFLDGEALAAAFASSDVFFFPSKTETFGNVTLEAMASGVPTVCADATGSRSLVLDGKTGFLAAPGNTSEFADALVRLIGDDRMRAELGAAGLARSREYTWEKAMGQLMAHYRDLLATRRRAVVDATPAANAKTVNA